MRNVVSQSTYAEARLEIFFLEKSYFEKFDRPIIKKDSIASSTAGKRKKKHPEVSSYQDKE